MLCCVFVVRFFHHTSDTSGAAGVTSKPVMSFLFWTGLALVPAAWSVWWRNRGFFTLAAFYFCVCAMSHAAAASSPTLDLLQHPFSLLFQPHIPHFTLSWHPPPPPVLSCITGNLRRDILLLQKQYLHNIKQITSGWRHVPVSKHTSRRGRWPRAVPRQRCQDRPGTMRKMAAPS